MQDWSWGWIVCAGVALGCGQSTTGDDAMGVPTTSGGIATLGEDTAVGTTAGPVGSGSGVGSSDSGGTTVGPMQTSTDDDDSATGPIFDVGGQPDVNIEPPYLEEVVYVHTSSQLYRLDPDSLALDLIGTFSGCSSVVDIAVDRDNQIFASSSGGIYSINPRTAECTSVHDSGFGNNLAFVPPGVLHPTREILVTYSGTQYRSLDLVTGVVTDHGTIPWSVSGDVVSVNEGPTYVSVSYPGSANHLLLVDPATGEMIVDEGPIGTETGVYGLAFWGGTVYGFSSSGNVTTILVNGDGTTNTTIVDSTAVSFWGAGSSTFAPVTPEG